MKSSDLRYALSQLELLRRITDGSLGVKFLPPEAMREKSPAVGRFFVILWKKILFIGIGLHFAPAQRNLKAGPQREIFSGGTEIDAGPPKLSEELTDQLTDQSLKFGPIFCPKLGEEQKKKGLHSNLLPFFAQKSGTDEGQGRKKILSKT